MNIQIKGRADVPNYREEFVVEIEVMFGDADGYSKIEVGPFKDPDDTKHLKDLLQTCERLAVAYPHGRGGSATYNHIEGFNRWFAADWLEEEEWEALPMIIQDLCVDWPSEPDGMGRQSGYQGYKLFYYNSTGDKFNAYATGINE